MLMIGLQKLFLKSKKWLKIALWLKIPTAGFWFRSWLLRGESEVKKRGYRVHMHLNRQCNLQCSHTFWPTHFYEFNFQLVSNPSKKIIWNKKNGLKRMIHFIINYHYALWASLLILIRSTHTQAVFSQLNIVQRKLEKCYINSHDFYRPANTSSRFSMILRTLILVTYGELFLQMASWKSLWLIFLIVR